MYLPDDPFVIEMAVGSINDLHALLNGTRVQGRPVTPDGKGDDGRTPREHLTDLKEHIDRFLASAR